MIRRTKIVVALLAVAAAGLGIPHPASLATATAQVSDEKPTKPKRAPKCVPERWRVELERKRARKAEARRVKEARRFVESVRVPGNEVTVRVERLTTELTWFRSLPAAQEEARRTGRPILWIHALGEIDGFL